MIHAIRSKSQAESSTGCQGASVRRTDGLTFWTLTQWDDQGSMRDFMKSGAHKKAMPKLSGWCCEASYANWDSETTPTWSDGERHLKESGTVSRVKHPTDRHAAGVTV